MQQKQKVNFDKCAKDQKKLSSGENVLMMKRSETKTPEQSKWEPATVVEE